MVIYQLCVLSFYGISSDELLDWLLIGALVFHSVTVLLRVIAYGLDEYWNRSKFQRAFNVLYRSIPMLSACFK